MNGTLIELRSALTRGGVATSIVLLFASSYANAADQGITGKKLLLKSTPKLVLLSKDAGISIAGSDPIGGADSSITFDDGSGPVTFSLPKTLWKTNGSGTLFKYKNASAPGGPSVVKVAKIKPGLLKVVAKGLPFAVPNGAQSIDVVLSLDGGTNTYCMTFSGTGDGSKLLVKDAPTGACPACPQTGGDVTACLAYPGGGSCQSCCDTDGACQTACAFAAGPEACETSSANDSCSAAMNVAGCADECCP